MSVEPSTLPLAVTIGDVAGIGPEVILKALQAPLPGAAPVVIYGALAPLIEADARLVRTVEGYRSLAPRLVALEDLSAPLQAEQLGVLEVCPALLDELSGITPGQPTAACAALQLRALERAIEDARRLRARAICTAPWTKHIFSLIDAPQVGHTEVLDLAFNAPHHVMMLAGPKLRVSLTTVHVPLEAVSRRLTASRLEQTIDTTIEGLQTRFGLEHVRLAVCGLNPHAGESGVMGDEEQTVIKPEITRAQARWGSSAASISGPWPADTLFSRFGKPGEAPFDAVICMYHDQGLIPLKLLHFGQSANLTLGLPIIRTSVDHGTAYDIAGQGVADEGSMRYAMELALTLRL